MDINKYPDLCKFYYICDYYTKKFNDFMDTNYRFINNGCINQLNEVRIYLQNNVKKYESMIDFLQTYPSLKNTLLDINLLKSDMNGWEKYILRYILGNVNYKVVMNAFISYNCFQNNIQKIVENDLDELEYSKFIPNVTKDIEIVNSRYNLDFTFKIFKDRQKCVNNYYEYARLVDIIYHNYMSKLESKKNDCIPLIILPILGVVKYEYDNGEYIYVQVVPKVHFDGDMDESKRMILNLAKQYGLDNVDYNNLYDYIPVKMCQEFDIFDYQYDNIWISLKNLKQKVKYNNVVLLCKRDLTLNQIDALSF